LDETATAEWKRRAQAAEGSVLPIVRVGDPGAEVLRQKARPVRHANRRVRALVADMWATMYGANGVGLAAPQVGVSQRILVADAGDRFCALLNPEIVAASGRQLEPLESCLSIPELSGEVERAERVRVRGLDPNGREVWVEAEGFFARVLQHEIDHLDGVLFTDRARRIVRPQPETKLRTVFLGTSDFGARVLAACLEGDVVPRLVVTRPDRPAGRGLRLRPSPVRAAAEGAGLEVVAPASARDPALAEALAAVRPDVLVTAAYGQIVPDALLSLPRLGAVNVHPSLLPLYRGPDPIRRALWNGERETGVTIQRMAREVDAGDVLLQERLAIEPDMDGGSLAARLADLAGPLLLRALRQLATGTAEPRPQDHARATFAPKILPEEEVADLALPAATLACRVRALAPRPGLRTRGGLKILRAAAVPGGPGAPGTVLGFEPGQGILVATGEGALLVREVQAPGGRPMGALDYARGRRLQPGASLDGS
jgi:methionyl-tRNA formyltransferase